MPPERDLAVLLASMHPVRRPGAYVFVTVPASEPVPPEALASVLEDEGRTLVLERDEADRRGNAYGFVAAWITLQVHSALDAVGLTAAVSAALTDAQISCNVLAGHHHDHLLVPEDRADDALAALRDLIRHTGGEERL
jgi:hypothetical protein